MPMKLWLAVPVLAASIATAGCDIVTAELRAEESAQWHKSYQLPANGRVEISNVNGKIDVEPSVGNAVEVDATKKARGASPEAAKAALERVTIAEDLSGGRIRVQTKVERTSGFSFMSGNVQVEYRVKVPAGAEVKFTTVNGGVAVTGLEGRIVAETTNGGVTARGVAGQLEASTTNGGLDIDLLRMPDGGVKLECTNGGIKVRLPKDAKANVSASITNGGISTENLSLDTTDSSRRHLEGRLNGGGPRLEAQGVNGGIKLIAR
jgi:DUF4097 and DUF4098 domain-containing protein YvlB